MQKVYSQIVSDLLIKMFLKYGENSVSEQEYKTLFKEIEKDVNKEIESEVK